MYPLPADCLLLLTVFGQGARDLTEERPYAMQGYELADNCIVLSLIHIYMIPHKLAKLGAKAIVNSPKGGSYVARGIAAYSESWWKKK